MGKILEDLEGIDDICKFMKRDLSTLMIWKTRFGFPMAKNKDNIWTASSKKIHQWLSEHELTIEKATTSALEVFNFHELHSAGKLPKHKKSLTGLEAIGDFLNVSWLTANEWARSYPDCPIRKNQEGQFQVDADILPTIRSFPDRGDWLVRQE